MTYDICLSIAGSDPSGGAGIQADLKTFSALGCYGAAAITAVTVQNTLGVRKSVPIAAEVVGEQVMAVLEDLHPKAVKLGMMVNKGIIHAVSECLRNIRKGENAAGNGSGDVVPASKGGMKRAGRPFVILDPILVSSSGHHLLDADARHALVGELMPLCDLITPNIPELEALTDETDCRKGAMRLMSQTGCPNVLVKGGHMDGAPTDLLFSGPDIHVCDGPRIDTRNTHGTGCTLSSAIAAYVALGQALPEAVRSAKHYVSEALSAGRHVTVGQGCGPMNHFFRPKPLVIEENE